MANIPVFESILAQIHQSVGIDPIPKLKKLARLESPMAAHQQILKQLTDELFDAFGLNEHEHAHACLNLEEWANFNTRVEQLCCTYDADLRQIVWFMAAYCYAPGLGRRLAFWTMAEPLDQGMPCGAFWFLPVPREKDGRKQLIMPVAQVLDWLVDLLGQPMEQIAPALGGGQDVNARAKTAKVDSDSILRMLYEWRNGRIPRRDNIERYFAEGSVLDFKGAFTLHHETDTPEAMQEALAFVRRKELNAEQLREQIPMIRSGRLEAVLSGDADAQENRHFIELLKRRYGPPALRTIRQRFLLARACQDGYRRLGALLLGDTFDESCADPAINKVLQLVAIFQISYNLTMEAGQECDSEAAEDAFFESRIAPWDRLGIFLSVLPSCGDFAWQMLAERLSLRFYTMRPGEPLEDHVGHDMDFANPIIERNIARLHTEREQDRVIAHTIDRMRIGSPWRALQKVRDSWVAGQMARHKDLPLRARQMVVVRMRELAAEPKETMAAICLELEHLLNSPDREHRPADAKAKVAALLQEAKANPAFEGWRAMILQCEAKHHLSFNDFATARRLFDAALEASLDRNMGTMRGKIARDALALMVEFPPVGFSLGNCERYMRHMLTNGGIELTPEIIMTPPALEDIAVGVSGYFWDDLYFPYPGETKATRLAEPESKRLLEESVGLIHSGDWDGLRTWFKQNGIHFRDKRLKEVRGHSALMAWMKILYEFESKQGLLVAMAPNQLQGELGKVAEFLKNLHIAIGMMIEAWPKLASLPDFKMQSPLMLAANNNDLVLLQKLLVVGADTGQQDFIGRTALHTAIAARSLPCVQALLVHAPEMAQFCAKGAQSPFHTAVRAGHVGIMGALVSHAAQFAHTVNDDELTALALAEAILDDPQAMEALKRGMAKEGRKTGSVQDFKEIVALLRGIH